VAIYESLAADIRHVAAESVVLNFECCGCCSETGFAGDARESAEIWRAIDTFISRGSFVMASDFSLKALIHDWQPAVLGPNPFVQLGGRGCGASFELRFDPAKLSSCPSAQLAAVGALCEQGFARSHAMPGTILYAVDESKAAAATAAGSCIEVLTVVARADGMTATQQLSLAGLKGPLLSETGGAQGLAGHVLLTRPSGGMLLTSMGHWIELTRLGVTEESLLSASMSHDAAFGQQVSTELGSARSAEEREAVVQRYSSKMVQMSSPCSPAARRR